MTTGALAGATTELKVGDGATPEVFTKIAEVTKINGFKLESTPVDASNHDGSGYEEMIMGLKKVGDITFDVNFVPTGATHGNSAGGLIHSWSNQELENYQLVFPDSGSTTWTVPAFVKSVEVKPDLKGKLGGTVVLTPSGAPTLA